MIPLKNAIYHVCELEVIPDKITSKIHPRASRLQKLLDRCRRWMILSSTNCHCKDFFRSRHAIMKERQRHLLAPNYRNIIHPFSKFAKFREICMTVIWSVLLILDPLMATFVQVEDYRGFPETVNIAENVHFLIACLAGMDIITNFFMGYAKKQTREVILEPRLIRKHYMLSYFIFDVAACAKSILPVIFDHRLTGTPVIVDVLVHQLSVLRLVRLGTVSEYFVFCLKVMNVQDSAVQCINIILSTLFILHWWTCIMCLIPLIYTVYEWDITDSWTVPARVSISDDRTIGERYVRFLLLVMCHFYGAGRTPFLSNNPTEMTAMSFIIVCGVGYYTYAIAVVGQLFRTANISETKYDELITQVKGYALSKKLPDTLRNRLLYYYESKFQRKFFQENTIVQSLSEHLRLEVMLYSSKHLIESVHVFRGLSKSAIGAMLSLLKQEIFLPGDRITSSMEINELYYFVSYGTVACILIQHDENTNKREKVELMHLEDGDHFGETSQQKTPDEEIFYTVAIELTEIFSLPKKKLLQCKEMFPEIATKIERMHQKRKEYINTFLRLKIEKTHEDILKELSYGRILLHGRKRR